MAVTLNITVTDAQAARVKKAFGTGQIDPATGIITRTDATAADIVAAIKNFVKGQVVSYEAQQASQTVATTGSAETW